MDAFLDPSCDEASLFLSTACDKKVKYSIENPCKCLSFLSEEGIIKPYTLTELKVRINRSVIKRGDSVEFCVHSPDGYAVVKVPFNRASAFKGEKVYHWTGRKEYGDDVIKANIHNRSVNKYAFGMNYISIPANGYSRCFSSPASASFRIIPDYSRGTDAIKAYPQAAVFGVKNAPYLEYKVSVPVSGKYDMTIYANPSNPFGREPSILVGISVNGGRVKKFTDAEINGG